MEKARCPFCLGHIEVTAKDLIKSHYVNRARCPGSGMVAFGNFRSA